MDSAMVDKIERLVRATDAKQRVVVPECEPEGVYYVVGPNGEMTRKTAMLPAAAERADDLETLTAVAVRRKDEKADGFVSVWYDRAGVQAVCAWHDVPADVCALSLAPSPQLAQLAAWHQRGRPTVPQKELVTLLRTLFAGCWDSAPKLLEAVRSLRTSKAAEVNSQIERGKLSLSRSMVADMSGVQAIPEEVKFVVPVFTGDAVVVRADVRVAIDPDPETEQFTLIVLPEEIERAYATGEERTRERLASLLEGEEIPLYHGRP